MLSLRFLVVAVGNTVVLVVLINCCYGDLLLLEPI